MTTETNPRGETYDRRPLYNIRIYEDILTDAAGRRYRAGAVWQVKVGEKVAEDKKSGEKTR